MIIKARRIGNRAVCVGRRRASSINRQATAVGETGEGRNHGGDRRRQIGIIMVFVPGERRFALMRSTGFRSNRLGEAG